MVATEEGAIFSMTAEEMRKVKKFMDEKQVER